MKRWLLGGFVLTVGFLAFVFLIDPAMTCGCAINPHVELTQAEAETTIAAPIPATAQNVRYNRYRIERGEKTETYVSFEVTPQEAEIFLATLPLRLPLSANPMTSEPTYITNFGRTPTTYESFAYLTDGLCEHYGLVDKSDSAMYRIYIFTSCIKT